MKINIIVAIGLNREIGCKNKLLIHLKEDLKYFKEKTMGQIVIMGKNTFDSLPNGPLPGRLNIVISKSVDSIEGAIVVKSIEESIEVAKEMADGRDAFIIGGASIYKQFMKYADRLYITLMQQSFPEADTFFPSFNTWKTINYVETKESLNDKVPHAYITLEREGC